jgi:hypothetical protein
LCKRTHKHQVVCTNHRKQIADDTQGTEEVVW